MIHRRFRVQIILRLIVVVGASLALAYLIGWTTLYEAYAFVAVILIYGVYSLIQYVEKTTRDLTRFLQAIRFADFSQGYVGGERGPIFQELNDSFDEVVSEFKRIRAEKEEQVRYLKNVIRHIGIALIAYREDGTVEFANAAAKRLLNVNRIGHVDQIAQFSEELAGALGTMPAGERVLVQVNSSNRTLQLAVYATRFTLRGTVHTLVSLQDIGNELEEREMEAWQQLTRVLTHEIMNSVAPISSLAATAGQLLQEGNGTGNGRRSDAYEALDVIQRRSNSLINFVDAYRSFTKIEVPDFELISVADLFRRVRQLLSSQSQSVTLTVSIEPHTLQLTADPDLIEQVLINLVLNAIQALENRPNAHVDLRAYVDRRGMPIVEISDNGPGISEDVQNRIFVPFFTTKEDGSGIGLSLSRQIMRLHGGSISVQSAPGDGATFTLRF